MNGRRGEKDYDRIIIEEIFWLHFFHSKRRNFVRDVCVLLVAWKPLRGKKLASRQRLLGRMSTALYAISYRAKIEKELKTKNSEIGYCIRCRTLLVDYTYLTCTVQFLSQSLRARSWDSFAVLVMR
jgi:hypothetical protein